MIRFALIVLALALPRLQVAIAAPAQLSVLPPHASIIRAAPLPGRAGEQVIVYTLSGRTYLSVASTSKNRHIAWRQNIQGQLTHLVTPGSNGVFLAVTRRTHGTSVYAYAATDSDVTSALAGRPAGRLFGDEGVVMLRQGFRIRKRDWKHQGSVLYRFVTEYDLSNGRYVQRWSRRMPDYPAGAYPTPNAEFHTSGGDTILLRLEVANTEQERQQGLMDRASLDPDSGMAFVWTSPVQESFWMENTLIPLTVAFIGADGSIQETQDMQAETCTFHTPSQPYLYAIEANLGFFAANGITTGDTVTFHVNGAPPPSPPPPGPNSPCRAMN